MRPSPPELIVITDWSLPRHQLRAQIEALGGFEGRVALQHRHPGAPVLQFLQEARVLARTCETLGVPLFINGRLDIALRVGAHLHLPSRSLRPADARPLLPGDRWISAAAHDAAELEDAEGADFLLVSPVFRPTSKEDSRPTLGVAGLEKLAARTQRRIYALGGVTPSSAVSIPSRFGLAAVGAVLHATDAHRAAEVLLATRR